METKDTLSSCPGSEEQEMQRMQKQAKIPFSVYLDVSVIQECKMQEVRALDASSGNIESGRIVSDKWSAKSLENDCSETGNDQSSGNESNTSRNASSRSGNECSKRSNSGNDTGINPSYDTEPMAEVPNYAYY
ncbi:hypothetical protein Tco_1205218, partial [Tanacetum coccineum]